MAYTVIPGDDPTLILRQQLFAKIGDRLGGRAAKEVISREFKVAIGVASDLQMVTSMEEKVIGF